MSGLLHLVLAGAVAAAGPTRQVKSEAEIRGAAVDRGNAVLYTWGDGITRWDADSLRGSKIVAGDFGEGGCLFDVDADGREDLVVQDRAGERSLAAFVAPDWRRVVLDGEIQMHDCLGTELFGRRGVLMVHRFMQVRFYEPPPTPDAEWRVRDIYSFYTASEQAGLLLSDVDGDGRQDILCGNYWIQSPREFDLPWRLFAINVLHELPQSARFRLALTGDAETLVAAQGEMQEGKVMLYRKPERVAEQWPSEEIGRELKFAYPHGLLTADLNGDGRHEIVIGENNGAASRVFLFERQGQGYRAEMLAKGTPVLAAFRMRAGVLTVGPDNVSLWSVGRR